MTSLRETALVTRRDGHRHITVWSVVCSMLITYIVPPLIGMVLNALDQRPRDYGATLPSFAKFLDYLAFSFLLSPFAIIPGILIGIAFLRAGLAGWLLVTGIGTVSGFLFGGAIERFEWESCAIGGIYALTLWLGLRLCAPESLKPRNAIPS